jgi:ABC-2 type transport system ATP-binding protein
MNEVEQICDRVGVIAAGRLVAEGTVDELRGEDALLVRADPLEDARRIVAGLVGVRSVEVTNGALRILSEPGAVPGAAYFNNRLIAAGIAVSELRMDQASLESVFLAMTASDKPVQSDDSGSLVHAKGQSAAAREALHG